MVTLGQEFLIALGGNMPSEAGDAEVTLRQALTKLGETDVEVVAVSRFYQTPAFPPGAGPDYVNAAAKLRFDGSASALLTILHAVEADFGRERVQRWGQRTLDLDLLAQGDIVLPDIETYIKWRDLPTDQQIGQTPPELILPHPRLQDRAFVLIPLADIASDWTHPVLGLSVSEMLRALPEDALAEIIAL